MGDLLVAEMVWLLGQDDQLLRPRVGGTTVAAAAGGLVDVVLDGGARWVDRDSGPHVDVLATTRSQGLVGEWHERLLDAAGSRSLPVIHAINALAPDIWETVGAELARRGLATEVPRPVRRWLAPRRRPDPESAKAVGAHLRAVLAGTEPAEARDDGLLAVASCAGIEEHLLSQTAFTDSGVIGPVRAHLATSDLVPRLERAVGYLVSPSATLGVSQSGGPFP